MKRTFITHITKEYLNVGFNLALSIRKFSNIPLIIYFVGNEQLNSNPFEEIPEVHLRFIKLDLEKFSEQGNYSDDPNGDNNFYVLRNSLRIYHILSAKTIAMEMALLEGWDLVCYLDSDCLATPHVDELFDWSGIIKDYPVATAGIHEYMIILQNDFQRGNPLLNSWPEPDNKLTLEWPLMNLLEMSEWSRGNYRTTGIMLMNQKCLDFIQTWKDLCFLLPKFFDVTKYAPFHEETVYNVLSWKKSNEGFPLCYINLKDGLDTVSLFYSPEIKGGESTWSSEEDGNDHSKRFFKIPEDKRFMKVLHGEKRTSEVIKILDYLQNLKEKGYFDESAG